MTLHRTTTERSEACHYLSMGLTDWNSSLIAPSILRTDRNLGTTPKSSRPVSERDLKSPPMFLRAFARSQMGGFSFFFFFLPERVRPRQGQSITQTKGNDVAFISIYAPSRVVQKTAIWAVTHISSTRSDPRHIFHKTNSKIKVEIRVK